MDITNRLHDSIAAVCPIIGVSIGARGAVSSVRISFAPNASSQQQTAAQSAVNAFDWSVDADATWQAQQAKSAAASLLDNGALQAAAASDRVIIALMQMILDEFNTHSAQTTALLAAIAAATSLANLQTRVAAISAIPARTQAQVIAAIKTKIQATAE